MDPKTELHEAEDRLVTALQVLASQPRMSILRQLRTPKVLREIVVSPADPRQGRTERPMARQAVKQHLERLIELGVVLPRHTERDYGDTTEYVVNHQALFALAEEFRGLASLRPATEPSLETLQATDGPAPYEIRGPCLVLVRGLDEGRSFTLDGGAGRKQWVIGRKRGLAVALDFDPFVSTENALISRDDDHYVVEDLPDSRNGTTLNFRLLPRGAGRRLRSGDIIGVGRSLLLFKG